MKCRDCGMTLSDRGRWADRNKLRHAKRHNRERREQQEKADRAFREKLAAEGGTR